MELIKKIKKRKIFLLTFFSLLVVILANIRLVNADFSNIFINYQSENSIYNFNYGSLISEADENNNYRNYFDTSIKANDVIYDSMTEFSNNIDYANYIYSQQYFEYNDDSFNLTNGNFKETLSSSSLDDYLLRYHDGSVYTNGTGITNAKTEIIGNVGSHNDVIKLSCGSPYVLHSITNTFDDVGYGTIEFYIYIDSQELTGSTLLDIILSDGIKGIDGTIDTIFEIDSEQYISELDYWNHYSINFDCINSGYRGLTKEYEILVNGISVDKQSIIDDTVQANCFMIEVANYDYYAFNTYIDAIGYSFDDNYEINDNLKSDFLNQSDFNKITSHEYYATIDFDDIENELDLIWSMVNGDTFTDYDVINTTERNNVLKLYAHYGGVNNVGQYSFFDLLENEYDEVYAGSLEFYYQFNQSNCQYNDFIITNSYNQELRYSIVNGCLYFANDINDYDVSNWEYLDTLTPNLWYHIRIDFNINESYLDLPVNSTRIFINDVEYGNFEIKPFYDIDSVCPMIIIAMGGDLCDYMPYSEDIAIYFDSLGYSWDENYTIGQNKDVEMIEYDIIENDDYYRNNGAEFDSIYRDGYYYSLNTYGGGSYVGVVISDVDDNYISTTSLNSINPNYIYGFYFDDLYYYVLYLNGFRIYDTSGNVVENVFFNSEYLNSADILVIDENVYIVYNNTVLMFYDNDDWDNVREISFEYNITSITYNQYNNYIYLFNDDIVREYQLDVYSNIFLIEINSYLSNVHFPDIVLYNDDLDKFVSFVNRYYYAEYDFLSLYISKAVYYQLYIYDDAFSLTGKVDFNIKSIEFTENYIINYDISFYYYQSSTFNLINKYKEKVNAGNNLNSLELQVHSQIGYRNSFKKFLLNISFIFNDNLSNIQTNDYSLDYNSNYKFDLLTLNQLNYSQSNTPILYRHKNILMGCNNRYFKNDLFGYRVIACLDLEQKFSNFFDFGMFNDIIDISEVIIPIPDNMEETGNPYWTYDVGIIEFETNEKIETEHLEMDYNTIYIDYEPVKHYYEDEFFTYVKTYRIGGDWGVWDFIRSGLNKVIEVLMFIPNAIIFSINMLIVGIQFVGYVFMWLFCTVIYSYFILNIILLFWNILLYYLIYGIFQLIESFLQYVIPFIQYLFEDILPVVIEFFSDILGWLIALVIWSFTGFTADFNEILEATTEMTNMITSFIYDTLLIILENVVIVVFYSGAYVLCVQLVFLKYFYTKARGFKSRSERIYESYLSYRLLIDAMTGLVKWFKEVVFRWT